MGSFPSQEQAVHPSGGLSDTDATTATHHQHHVQTRMHTRHTLIKKRTRGKLLFLGLDGAGKSTIIYHLIRSLDEERTNIHSTSTAGDAMGGGDDHGGSVYPNPSKAHQSWSYRLEGDCYLQVLDVPGRREFRRKWYTTALTSSDSISALYSSVPGSGGGNSQTLPLLGVVFVVDASDRVRFPIVAEELIRFQKLKEQKKTFQRTQFFLLLNKTDKTTAAATLTGSQSNIELQKQANETERRTAMRFARRELKKCVDHQLHVDQKRNPHDYRHSSSSFPLTPTSNFPSSSLGSEIPPGAPPDIKSLKAQITSTSRATLTAEASATRTTAMMTSIMECNAHDRENIKSVHAWIKEEIKKVM